MFLPLGRTLAGLAILFFWSQSMAFERDLIRAWNTHTTKARQALERYQTEAGLAEFEAALKAAEQLGGKEAYRLVNTLDELGFTYLDNGRLEDAERVILRAKQIKERDFPKHERYQLTGMFLEGLLYAHLGEIEKGEAMVRQIEKRAAFVSGGFGFGVALCEACLADAYARNDRFAEAEALYQKAIRKFLNPTTQSGWVMRFDARSRHRETTPGLPKRGERLGEPGENVCPAGAAGGS
jgi:tetratricopeptide (TPR) repeat protein